MGVAAASDLRERRVRDELWTQAVRPAVGVVLVPTLVLLFDPLVDTMLGRKSSTEGKGETEEDHGFPVGTAAAYGAAFAVTAFALWDLRGDSASFAIFVRYLTVPVMMIVFRGMYEVHLLKGGADAKAMITIAAFVPQYPDLPPFPLIALDPRLTDVLRVLFPFSLLVLLDAALLFLAAPVAFLAYNATRGHLEFPMALLGYKVPLDRVPKHAWFMDQVLDGEHVLVYFPTKKQDRKAILQALREAGLREAWVTPQLPFMVPLAVGFVLAFLAGNPLMGLLQALT